MLCCLWCSVQIRDVVITFHKHRLEFKLLYDYRSSGGQMPPPHDTMQFEALKRRLVNQHEAGVCMCELNSGPCRRQVAVVAAGGAHVRDTMQ